MRGRGLKFFVVFGISFCHNTDTGKPTFMTSTASSHQIDEQSVLPIARIDAQEEEYVQPLREYLETNGCRVIINKPTPPDVAYAIASGDFQFVKDIFSKSSQTNAKRLGIVFNSSLSDAEKLTKGDTKIVVVDPVYLLPKDVEELFLFFFTESSTVVDKRRTIHEPITHSPSFTPKSAMLSEESQLDDIEFQLRLQSSKTVGEIAPHEKIPETVLSVGDEKRIGSIVSDVFGEEGAMSKESKNSNRKPRRKKMHMSFGIVITFLVMLFMLPCVWYVGSVSAVVASFAIEVSRIKQGDLTGAGRFDAVGNYWLYQGRLSFGVASLPMRLAGVTSVVRGQERLLSFLSDTSSGLSETLVVSASAKNAASELFMSSSTGGDTQPASSLEHIRVSVETIMQSMGLAQAELETLINDNTFPFSITPISDYAKKGEASLISIRGVLTYIDNLLTLYPQVAGFREPKTYLVLLQNSNELRTTGGFIGTVGLAKFDSGVLSDFTIQDVYAVDGQLKGHVDPPVPIRELLGEEHWYLRDSNWDPDFKESGARAAWFYEKETGVTVDGVIAINVPVVVDLLKATGPIFLPDYNDRISADNFFGKSLYYTQNNSFAGSTQKSDFLGTLSRAILTEITTNTNVNSVNIFRAVAVGLASRDILFTFTDPDIQQLVEHFDWAGRVFDTTGCKGESQSCLFDPFGAFEENVSVNKVNYFIKRSTKRNIVLLLDGKMSETFTLNLQNTANLDASSSAQGVGGVYTPYIRFFMTPDVEVQNVTLDGVPIPSRNPKLKKLPTIPYLEATETATSSGNIKGIGVAVSIPPGEQHAITITMNRVTPIPFVKGVGELDLLYYKHPGVSDEHNQTIIQYPISWNVKDQGKTGGNVAEFLSSGSTGADSFIAKEGQLEYNSTILQDQNIDLTITQ